jgi:hypothetical protein
MSLSFVVDGSESGVDPHETWRGNSTASEYLMEYIFCRRRLEQPSFELVLFGAGIIGG